MADVDVTTYGDDKCFGFPAPSLQLLEFVRGDKIDLQPGKVHIIFFFVTFYKGAYPVNEELTCLWEKYGKDVTVVAINNDAEKEKCEKYLGKTIVDENTKKELRLAVPYVAYDDKKATGKMYAQCSELSVLGCPHAFIVDKDGKIAWRQQFTQAIPMSGTNFEVQLQHVLKGEKCDMNGPRPKPKDEGEAAEDMPDDIGLF